MEKRTKEFLQVSFYLSKFGEILKKEKYPYPPKRLKVKKWNEAYRIFYEKLNGGRDIQAFERSLKNARDAFDSHFPNSGRVGWRAENRKPNPLGKDAKVVFDEFKNLKEDEVWDKIKQYSDLKVKEYSQIIKDIISIQESEKEYKISQTEGGRKIFTSRKYERSLHLRNKAVEIHGLKCKVCDFDFKEMYGDWGNGFIEVHHLQPLSKNKGKEVETNPELDLTVLCANCHRMVHRKKGFTLTIEELKKKVEDVKAKNK